MPHRKRIPCAHDADGQYPCPHADDEAREVRIEGLHLPTLAAAAFGEHDDNLTGAVELDHGAHGTCIGHTLADREDAETAQDVPNEWALKELDLARPVRRPPAERRGDQERVQARGVIADAEHGTW